jgi:hypothetical protein
LKKQLAICAGLLLLGFGTARLAEAQAVYVGPGSADPALPPYEIMSIVRSTGLAPLTRPMRRGPYYVLVAVDRVGRQMRVVVDAQLGDIVNLRPALAAGSYGPEGARSYGPESGRPNGVPGAAPPLPDNPGAAGPYGSHAIGEGGAPAPPRSIPNARALNAPAAAAPPAPLPPTRAAAPPPPAPPPTPATRVAVAEPALPALPPSPPLPRPRPKLALNEAPVTASPPVAPVGDPGGSAAPAASAGATAAPASPSAPAAAPPSPTPNDTAEPGKQIE